MKQLAQILPTQQIQPLTVITSKSETSLAWVVQVILGILTKRNTTYCIVIKLSIQHLHKQLMNTWWNTIILESEVNNFFQKGKMFVFIKSIKDIYVTKVQNMFKLINYFKLAIH